MGQAPDSWFLDQGYYPPKEAKRILGCSDEKLLRLRRSGKLKTTTSNGNKIGYLKEEVRALLPNNKRK